MALRHHGRRHGEQNAVGVHQSDLRSHARESHRLALHHRDANVVREQAHHRGFFDPGNLLQLPAPLAERDKKYVAPDVFAEDRQHVSAADFAQPGNLNAVCPFDAETRVVVQISL